VDKWNNVDSATLSVPSASHSLAQDNLYSSSYLPIITIWSSPKPVIKNDMLKFVWNINYGISLMQMNTLSQARSHGGIGGQCPPTFMCSSKFCCAQKNCFKHKIKTKFFRHKKWIFCSIQFIYNTDCVENMWSGMSSDWI